MDSTNLFVGCTNIFPKLDSAFIRRFDLKLEFTRPAKHIRESVEYFVAQMSEFHLICDAESANESITQKRMNLSYDEIEGIVHRAMKRAVLSGTTNISLAEIYADFKIELRIPNRFNPSEIAEPTAKEVEINGL